MRSYKGFLKSESKRAFSYKFGIAVILFLLVRFSLIFEELSLYEDIRIISIAYLSQFFSSPSFFSIGIAISLIPFGQAFVEDRTSGFGRYAVFRMDRRSYRLTKTILVWATSVLVVLTAYATLLAVLKIMGIPWANQRTLSVVNGTIYQWRDSHTLLFLFSFSILQAMHTGFWAVVSVLLLQKSKMLSFVFLLPVFMYQLVLDLALRFRLPPMMRPDLVGLGRIQSGSAMISFVISFSWFLFATWGMILFLTYYQIKEEKQI